MKNIFLALALVVISISSHSQKDTLKLSFEDNFNGSYSKNGIGSVSAGLAGENSAERGKIRCSMVTNYSFSYQQGIAANELLNKTNVSYGSFFLIDVYSRSMARSIAFDNSFGLGIGKKVSSGKVDLSLSYAAIYQETLYSAGERRTAFRSSLRCRVRLEGESIGIYSEAYYQPRFGEASDYIVYVNSRLVLNPKKKVSFLLQDAINYASASEIKMLHTLSFGIGVSLRSAR